MAGATFDKWYEEHGKADEPLAPSDYDFIIIGSQVKTTQSGKDMIVIQAKVESGPRAGAVVYNNFVISPESDMSMKIFFRQMTAIGLTAQFWSTKPTTEQVSEALKGRRFYGSTENEEYQGQERSKLKMIRPARGQGGAGAAPPPPPAAAPAPPAAPAAPAPPPPAPAAPEAPPAPPAPEPAQETVPPTPQQEQQPADIPPPPPPPASPF